MVPKTTGDALWLQSRNASPPHSFSVPPHGGGLMTCWRRANPDPHRMKWRKSNKQSVLPTCRRSSLQTPRFIPTPCTAIEADTQQGAGPQQYAGLFLFLNFIVEWGRKEGRTMLQTHSGGGATSNNTQSYAGRVLRLRDDVDELHAVRFVGGRYVQAPFTDSQHILRQLRAGLRVIAVEHLDQPVPVLASATADDCHVAVRFGLAIAYSASAFPIWQFEELIEE